MHQYMLQPYSWYIDPTSIKSYQIMVWCLDDNNEPCLVRISQFCHYVHLRIPDIMPAHEIDKVIEYIRSIPEHGVDYAPTLVEGKLLYYFGPKRKFIRIRLNSFEARYRLTTAFKTGDSRIMKVPGTSTAHEYEFCDITVDPIIKYLGYDENQSLTKRHCHWYEIRNTYEVVVAVHKNGDTVCSKMRDLIRSLPKLPVLHSSCPAINKSPSINLAGARSTPSGAELILIVEAETEDAARSLVTDRFSGTDTDWEISTCTHRSGPSLTTGMPVSKVREYTVSANDFMHVPGVSKISKPRVLSFDIETYSSGAYEKPGTMPDKMNPDDIIFSISYSIYDGATKRMDEGLFTVIPPDLQSDMRRAIDGFEGLHKYTVIMCESETEMLQRFFDLINEASPTIIIGFNSLGYDWPQIITRWNSSYCYADPVPNISLMLEHNTKNIVKAWSSEQGMSLSATYPSMPGRIHLDLRDIIKSEMKLPNYSLEVTAQIVLGYGKEDVTYTEMFVRYHKLIHGIGDREQVIHDMAQVLLYSAVDASLVTQVFNRRNCWINLVVACNVMFVTPEERYMRGTQHSNFNLITAQAIVAGYMINRHIALYIDFKGGMVQDPVPGRYKNLISADFAGLYPSIMMAYNICWTTCVRPGDISFHKCAQRFDVDNPSGGVNTYYFIKREDHEGVLPKHLKCLTDTRAAVRKQLSAHAAYTKQVKAAKGKYLLITGDTIFQSEIVDTVTDIQITDDVIFDFENESARLDAMQLSIKVCANSAYGMMGAQNGGKLCLVPGADTTTYMGRWWIQKVNERLVKDYGAKIVYGDTDSTMFDMGITDPAQCSIIGNKIVSELNSMFPPPMKLESENPKGVMICLKKKRYLAYLLDSKGNLNKKSPLIKGALSARRDNCKYQRTIYSNTAYMCLDYKSPREVLFYIASEFDKLRQGLIDVRDLIITTGIREHYKKESDPRAILKKRMLSDHGIELTQGMRVEYLLTTRDVFDSNGRLIGSQEDIINQARDTLINPEDMTVVPVLASAKMKKGEMMLLASTYNDILSSGGSVQINYDEYIRMMSKQMDDLFSISYKSYAESAPMYGLMFGAHFYHISRPCNMLYRAIQNYTNHQVRHHPGTVHFTKSTVSMTATMEAVLSGPNVYYAHKCMPVMY